MITNSIIAWGDQLGAQLSSFANLFYISKETNQKIVFFEELSHFKRGFQFLKVFDIEDVLLVCRASSFKCAIIDKYNKFNAPSDDWKRNMRKIYSRNIVTRGLNRLVYDWVLMGYKDFLKIQANNSIHADSSLLRLENNINYDILSGYGTYQDWGRYEEELRTKIRFKDYVSCVGDEYIKNVITVRGGGRKIVSVHFRRTDYLVMSSLVLDNSYYEKAMSYFCDSEVLFLIFSDDIGYCKTLGFLDRENVMFVSGNSAEVDLYLMSQSDSCIIANSSFSFWGAILGKIKNLVICPYKFIGDNCSEYSYMNGNWFPSRWISI